ncbi:MAG: glycosyltransferase [Verrucomicrobiota bacterium]
MSQPSISAYIPCFNNAATLAEVIASIRAQRPGVDDLVVIDDGSTDRSASVAESLGARVVRHEVNLGRGAARARAMCEARHDLVLCCDGTTALSADFLERALPWFDDPKVAAVFGHWAAAEPGNSLASRWRARHLFKCDLRFEVARKATLSTWGAMVRKSLCEAAGGFDPKLRHSEDADLGQRLIGAGYDVVFDPAIQIFALTENSVCQVLERYWRWHAGSGEAATVRDYLKQIAYSIKVMACRDLAAGDPLSLPISLLSPHYQFWKTAWRRFRGVAQSRQRL